MHLPKIIKLKDIVGIFFYLLVRKKKLTYVRYVTVTYHASALIESNFQPSCRGITSHRAIRTLPWHVVRRLAYIHQIIATILTRVHIFLQRKLKEFRVSTP